MEQKSVLNDEKAHSLTKDDLQNVLIALASSNHDQIYRSDSRILASAVFEALKKDVTSQDVETRSQEVIDGGVESHLLGANVTVLSRTGSEKNSL